MTKNITDPLHVISLPYDKRTSISFKIITFLYKAAKKQHNIKASRFIVKVLICSVSHTKGSLYTAALKQVQTGRQKTR